MHAHRLTLALPAPCRTVFNFFADIEHLPAWSGGWCGGIELHREGWWAYTMLGELALESMVDDIAGVIDLRLRHSAGWTAVVALRVRADGAGGVILTAACRQPAGLADEDYERWGEALVDGLRDFAARGQLGPVAA